MKNEFEAWKFFEYVLWSFLVSLMASIVTFLANLMQAKDRKTIDIVGLLIETAFCSLFGTLMGVSVYLVTDSMSWGFFACSIFGMFGEKLYARMSKRADTIDVGDFLNLNTILTDDKVEGKQEKEIQQVEEVKDEIKGKKYFVGCSLNRVNPTAYDGFEGELRSPDKDIDFFKALATKKGYEIYRCLADGGATNTGLIETLSSLAKIVKSDDTVMFVYSGHGGQSTQQGKQGEVDYETLCLYDGQMWEQNLRYLLGRIPCKVVAIFDCCHSGGLSKAMLQGFKGGGIPKSMAKNASVVLSHRMEDADIDNKNTLFLAACRKDEIAYDGKDNGFFTNAIKQIIDSGNKKISYRFAIEKACELIGMYQHPNIIGENENDLFFE